MAVTIPQTFSHYDAVAFPRKILRPGILLHNSPREAWISELENEEDITGIAASSLNFHHHFEKHVIPKSLWTAVKNGLDGYYRGAAALSTFKEVEDTAPLNAVVEVHRKVRV